MRVLKRARDEQAVIEASIREAIESLRALLHVSTAGIELLAFERQTGIATVRIQGDCPDCEMSAAMLSQGIEQHLRMRVSAIRTVRVVPVTGSAADG